MLHNFYYHMSNNLEKEADAFNKRIEERAGHGFIPDLENGVKCEYFYKSIFRDPYYMKLYFNRSLDFYKHHFSSHFGLRKLKILDVGCGPGVATLELARAGHDVLGIDIASSTIDIANKTAQKYFKNENGGSLEYKVQSLDEVIGKFEVILFSGVLHHLEDLTGSIDKINELLNPNGLLTCLEPFHEKFVKNDAAIVGFLRILLSITGHWYEDNLKNITTHEAFDSFADDILTEYRLERDKHEVDGQSPNDLSHDGNEILEKLRHNFIELETKPCFSFIYRFLGGIRGDDDKAHQIAKLVTLFDTYATANNIMNPNYFLFCGKKK